MNDQNNIISITNRTDKHAEKISADLEYHVFIGMIIKIT